MGDNLTDDVRIREIEEVIAPKRIIDEIPISAEVSELVVNTRENIRKIIPKLEKSVEQYEKPKIIDSPLFYMQEFKKNLKVFMPGDEYFNMEVVFERSPVNDIFYLVNVFYHSMVNVKNSIEDL